MYWIWETKLACDFAVLVLQCKFATSPSAQPDWYVYWWSKSLKLSKPFTIHSWQKFLCNCRMILRNTSVSAVLEILYVRYVIDDSEQIRSWVTIISSTVKHSTAHYASTRLMVSTFKENLSVRTWLRYFRCNFIPWYLFCLWTWRLCFCNMYC